MIGAHPNLARSRDVHALPPGVAHDVRRINVLIFVLMDLRRGPRTRAPAPDALQHLLFLCYAAADVIYYAVHAANSLQVRVRGDARAGSAARLVFRGFVPSDHFCHWIAIGLVRDVRVCLASYHILTMSTNHCKRVTFIFLYE